MGNGFGNVLLRLGALGLAGLPGGRRAASPGHVLVVRLGNLGDIVVALPAFQALRGLFPEARFTLLTSPTERGLPGAAEVLANDPTFDELIVYYRDESSDPQFLRGLRKRIRALQIDFAVLLPDDLARFGNLAKHMALLGAAGVRRVAGARLVDARDSELGQTDRLMRLIGPLGSAEVMAFPWIRCGAAAEAFAAQALPEGEGRVFVGMQCGAKRQSNRWPIERFVEVGRWLVEEVAAGVVLTGGPGERGLSEAVASEIGSDCLNLAGETSIIQLAAVAARCAAFVSNDTGTMHVAAAMGVPVVAIFSARDRPHRWYPYGEKHRVLRRDIECGPCYEDVCPLYEMPECLWRIPVEDVTAALSAVLRR